MRASGSPRALIVNTYRLCHHSKSDDHRPEAEVAIRWQTEPLVIQRARLSEEDWRRVDSEVDAEIAGVVATARALP